MVIITGNIDKNDNPNWPPNLGEIVAFQRDKKILVGKVVYLFPKKNAVFVYLINEPEHKETLVNISEINDRWNKDGIAVLIQSNPWKYVDPEKFRNSIERYKGSSNYNILVRRFNEVHIFESDSKTFEHTDPKVCDIDDGFRDSSLINEKGELQIDNLLDETKIINQFDDDEELHIPTDEVKKMLIDKLNNNETIRDDESKIIVNKSIAIESIIDNKDDENNEGRKIMRWIAEKLIVHKEDDINIFSGIKMAIWGGYVHITRKGINPSDIITKELIPNLELFKWQYDVPINYDTLKYLLFQNDEQKRIDSKLQNEAKLILSQEYIIALQPLPRYQMWAVKRLIMCWYADDILQNNIRKVKILINQWRGKTNKKFNKTYGVQSSIIIYPRYGIKSAKTVLKKISEYFTMYNNIAWVCSRPSYFTKLTDLIWYSNGNNDLKLYFRVMKNKNNGVSNRTFSDKYRKLIGSENLTFPYI